MIQDVVEEYELCNSLKAIPAEVFEHSNSISSSAPGHVFFVEIDKRSVWLGMYTPRLQ